MRNLATNRHATLLNTFAAGAITIGLIIRLIGLPHTPFWIDENFTAAIASQSNFADFVDFARSDAPPSFSFYFLMHLWQMGFGLSDVALRAPSLIFSLVTPLVVAFTPVHGLSREQRMTWAALITLWIPGIDFAQEARAYALLMLFATIQTLLFCHLLRQPSLRRAALWVVAAECTIAAHYDAAYLILAEGLIFLVVGKQAALKTWPAVILATPILVEIAWKLPILERFAASGTAWYPLLDLPGLFLVFVFLLDGIRDGGVLWLMLLPVLVLGAFILGRNSPASATDAETRTVNWTVLAAVLGCILIVVAGFLRPQFYHALSARLRTRYPSWHCPYFYKAGARCKRDRFRRTNIRGALGLYDVALSRRGSH